ncbi:MAG TPA: AraC family transcriptional regulator [Marinilabiliaceae bacterium]|nr:AraC family transcriptional regulator [Marinilabiliaceae bacterium]
MKLLFLKILKSKYIFPVVLITALFIGVIVYFSTIEDLILYPNIENYKFDYYTDEPNGGNSQIESFIVTDSIVKLEFLLKDGFQSPYVGLTLSPLLEKYIDAEKYNQISLNIAGQNINRIGFAIYTPPLEYAGNRSQDEALYHSYLNISDEKRTYNFPIKQLKHPEWWEDLHQISPSKRNKPNFKNILHLNIGSAFVSKIEGKKALKIYSIAFTRNNQKLFFYLGLIYVIILLSYFGTVYLILSGKFRTEQITVFYKPLDVVDNKVGVDKCIEYINNNFQDSEINLEQVAAETGINQRTITHIINEEYSCNFKTYINRIRICEAKRLLCETDLNIGEIAYKVGFNNQSHFNRVFRAEMEITPSEYRDNHS